MPRAFANMFDTGPFLTKASMTTPLGECWSKTLSFTTSDEGKSVKEGKGEKCSDVRERSRSQVYSVI